MRLSGLADPGAQGKLSSGLLGYFFPFFIFFDLMKYSSVKTTLVLPFAVVIFGAVSFCGSFACVNGLQTKVG